MLTPAEIEAAQRTSSRIQGRWKIPVLHAMLYGPIRIGALQRTVPGATKKMLIETLQRLLADGLVVKQDLGTPKHPHTEYRITPRLRASIESLLRCLGKVEKV